VFNGRRKTMKILIASAEVVPFAKTGGLADVAGALPKALSSLGHDVKVIMPKYKMIDNGKFDLDKIYDGIEVEIAGRKEFADVYEGAIPGTDVTVYFIANEKYFGRDGLYQDKGVDYPDNCERFSFYCRAAMEVMKKIGWKPDIIHANDWQSALIIMYAKTLYKDDPFFAHAASVYSTHNMGYQGTFPSDQLPITGLGREYFNPDSLEFYGKIALTKAGFVYADIINTVSPTYAHEIQTAEFGYGLEGLIQSRKKDVYGIVNGIDYELWDPATDTNIAVKFNPKRFSLKEVNKRSLQAKNGLPQTYVPVIGIISRLADQKGFDILAQAIEGIMQMNLQIILLGTGEPKYHELFKEMKKKYPDHLGLNLGFDAALAQLIYAGSDMFLMPSRYEPCGLGQLISYKYGTVPIVRKTGGLADTVTDGKTGFVFEEYSAAALLDAIKRAVDAYKDRNKWQALAVHDMGLDYSWNASAKKYVELYEKAVEKVPEKPKRREKHEANPSVYTDRSAAW
jgi:starch synthase